MPCMRSGAFIDRLRFPWGKVGKCGTMSAGDVKQAQFSILGTFF